MAYRDEKSLAEVIFNGDKFLKKLWHYVVGWYCNINWVYILKPFEGLSWGPWLYWPPCNYSARTFLRFYLWNVAFPSSNCLLFFVPFLSGAAAAKGGGGSPLRGSPGAGQQPVQVVIKDSPIILAQVNHLPQNTTVLVSRNGRYYNRQERLKV